MVLWLNIGDGCQKVSELITPRYGHVTRVYCQDGLRLNVWSKIKLEIIYKCLMSQIYLYIFIDKKKF